MLFYDALFFKLFLNKNNYSQNMYIMIRSKCNILLQFYSSRIKMSKSVFLKNDKISIIYC